MILQNYLKKLPKHLAAELPEFDFDNIEYTGIRGRKRKHYRAEILTIRYKDGTYDIIEVINRDYYVSYADVCSIADLIRQEL